MLNIFLFCIGLTGLGCIPIFVKEYLKNKHNEKLIESLKILNKNGNEMKYDIIQKYNKKAIDLFL